MSIFYATRRVIQLVMIGVAVAAGLVLYQHRAVFDPIWLWWEAYQNQADQPLHTELISGKVVQVVDPATVQLERGRSWYTVRMTGLVLPTAPAAGDEKLAELENTAKDKLAGLVMKKEVEVQLTYGYDAQRGLGIVFLGATNINAVMLREGYAKLKREYLKGLPVRQQFQIMRAEQLARQQKRGLWKLGV